MNKKILMKWEVCRKIAGAVVLFSFTLLSLAPAHAESNNKESLSVAYLLQQKKVTLTIKNKSIRFILNEIRKQSGIDFILQDSKTESDLEQLSITVRDCSVEDALEQLLKERGYTYRIEKNVIVLEKVAVQKKATVSVEKKIPVEGTIVGDDDKKAIAGATVIVEGTQSGAITDINGKFTLNVSIGDVLEISYVGKVGLKYSVRNDQPIVLSMKNDAMALDDVVVTGYGDVKRSSYTGNAVTVNRQQLLNASKTNVIKALQSFDPSFRIKQNNQWGSDPNSLPEVYIRGESGIGVKQLDKNDISKSELKDNPNLPTFIMDGFEVSVTKLYDYDPNRIESITILKDAAATAMYGSRAANGVVVITTVKPKPGKLSVTYNLTGGITFPDLSDYDLLNAAEKLELERRAGCFEYNPTLATGIFELENEYNAKLANVKKGVDTYWLSQPLKTVFNHKHSFNVEGGSETFRFGIDLQYTNEDGVMKGSLRDRIGAGVFLQYNYKNLSIRNDVSYSVIKSKDSPYGNFTEYAEALPYDVYQDESGKPLETLREWSYNSMKDSKIGKVNPLYEPSLNNFDRNSNEQLINNLSINWNILPGLLLKGQLSLTKEMGKEEHFIDPLSKRNATVLSLTELSSGELRLKYSDAFTLDMNTMLSYNKNFGKNNLNLIGGINMKESTDNGNSAKYKGFPSGVLNSPNYAREMESKTNFTEATSRMVGFLVSMNYSYDDIYLMDASCRIDGSSAFGSDKRFAPFWSMGLGVNIHNYKFLEESKVISLLKIRGSYGQTGKANFPAYAARTSYIMLTDEWYKTGYGAKLQALGNSNLKWETTNTFDIGGEIGFLNDLIYLKGSYYNKKTIDLINDVTIPSSTGFTTYRDNIGEVLNKGYEFDFRAQVIRTSEINFIVNANMAHNKNKIVKISESLKAYNERVVDMYNAVGQPGNYDYEFERRKTKPFMQYTEGGSLSSLWGVRSLGINPADGKEIFVRSDGTLTDVWNVSDQTILGTTEPKGQGSFGLNFNYKRFSIYTSFMYEFGSQAYNQTLVDKVENVNVYITNVDRRVATQRWSKPGDIAKYSSVVSGRGSVPLTRATSRFVEDYNVLSWSSLNIGYDFSAKLIEPLHLSMLRLEVGMNDLFNISSVKQERGTSYPFARTINFSLRASF